MIFLDTSFYLSYLFSADPNHDKAIALAQKQIGKKRYTTQAIVGEVLTVGSMRFNRALTIEFVQEIIRSDTRIILETKPLITRAWEIFLHISLKNISWVDCLSCASVETYHIPEIATFDNDFAHLFRQCGIPCRIIPG